MRVPPSRWYTDSFSRVATVTAMRAMITIAMEMLITGRILSADEALRWGLVGHVVEKGGAVAKAKEIAAVICANGPLSVAASKASAVETGWLPEDEARPIEGRYAKTV